MTFVLRPYQTEAIEVVHKFICEREGNPCVCLPTGSGKSVVMAALIQKWQVDAPWVRGCVLAHRKELVNQNAQKLSIAGSKDVGIFSAGLGKKDYNAPVLFASIDSIYKHAGDFQPFDFLFVDEAHRIPPSGEGKYRTFIAGCKQFSHHLRVVGWTATPFRMGCGDICHKDHILNELVYDAKVTDLIGQGYLCNLRSKVGYTQPDLRGVERYSRGDYKTSALAKVVHGSDVVSSAIAEAARIIKAEQRQSIVFFCVDIEHCKRVSDELRRNGIYAPCVTGKTPAEDRDRIVKDFRAGFLKAMCNVNVFTEGFDVERIDCIVLLRPTLSAGLFSQMVGRGLRRFFTKTDCLVLDFAGCIEQHGPIDLIGGQHVTMAVCGQCRESFSRAVRNCPKCGWEIPKQEIDRLELVERQRRMHDSKASDKSILSKQPEVHKVDAVYVARHIKPGSPDSVRVQYRCGLSIFREWVCLDHGGQVGEQAQRWWKLRVGNVSPTTVSDAVGNLLAGQFILDWTKTITVLKDGKYWKVIGYNQITNEGKINE